MNSSVKNAYTLAVTLRIRAWKPAWSKARLFVRVPNRMIARTTARATHLFFVAPAG